jgi:hypothetical protein
MEYVNCPNCRAWPCVCAHSYSFHDSCAPALPSDVALKILQCLERIEKLIEDAQRRTALENISASFED